MNSTRWLSKVFSQMFRLCLLTTMVLMGTVVSGSGAAVQAQQLPARYAAIVMDYESGNTVFSYRPDRVSYPASLTKVMTLYLLFDALEQGRFRLDSMLPVSSHATRQAPSRLGLKVGERISVEDAIEALVVKSANDIAVVVAEAVGGNEPAFAQLMTRKAQSLGMRNTVYRNASGLPNKDQISTPRDQAILARSIIRAHTRYYRYFSTRQFTFRGQAINTHNRLMLRYDGADGMKTGYINASGFNLIASAKRDGRRLIGVVFGGDTGGWRDNNMAQILDKGFARARSGDTSSADDDSAEDSQSDLDDLIASAGNLPKPAPQKPKAQATAAAAPKSAASWSVQVGTFSTYKQAESAVRQARRRLGNFAATAEPDVLKVQVGGKAQFRARLDNFSESQARAACRRLQSAKQDCMIIKP